MDDMALSISLTLSSAGFHRELDFFLGPPRTFSPSQDGCTGVLALSTASTGPGGRAHSNMIFGRTKVYA